MHLIGWLSIHHLVLFLLEFWFVLSFGSYFLSWCACYIVRDGALGIPWLGQPRSLHCGAVCGEGVWEGTMLLAISWLSETSPTTHKQIGPSWCWFPGEWVCACSRTLWVSQMNFLVSLGVSHATLTPTDVFSQRFWGFISLGWNPGLHDLFGFPVFPPGLSTRKCGNTLSASCHLAHPGPPATSLLHVLSAPATHYCPS